MSKPRSNQSRPKKARALAAAVVLVGLAALVYTFAMSGLFDGRDGPQPVKKRGIVSQEGLRVPIEGSAGVGEDPHGRTQFEWMRLHDPSTGRIPPGIRAREMSYATSIPTRDFLSKLGKNGEPPLDWTTRGPIRIGGRTRALGIDRRDPNVLNAGGVSGGMWHSEDAGATWSKATRPDQHHSVTTLVQDPRPGHEDTWYYGSGEFIGNSASAPGGAYLGTGLYRSDDNGETWELAGFEPAGESPTFDRAYDVFFNLAIDPTNTDELELYAATFGLIYRFDGTTRETLLIDDPQSPTFSSFTDVAITDEGVVYAALSSDGGRSGLWRSTDGDDWTDITPDGWPNVFQRTVIAVAPSNQNIVYFLAHTSGTNHVLWAYDADGGTWENRTENLPTAEQFPVHSNFPENLGAFDSQGGYDLIVDVKPDDPDVVFIGGTNLYRSTDGFASTDNTHWIAGYHPQQFIYPNHHPDMHAIAFDPTDPNRMYTGSDGGVHRTNNVLSTFSSVSPVSWIPLNDGYRTTQFYSVAIDESAPGSEIVVGGMQDNGTVFTNEETGTMPWIGDILGGDGSFADIADGQARFYVSAQNAQIFRMRIDEEGNVLQATRVDPTEAEFGAGLFITPFHLDPNDQSMMYLGGGTALYRNENLLAISEGNQDETDENWTRLDNTDASGGVLTAVTPTATSATATRVYYATFNSGASTSSILRLENADDGQPTPVDVTQRSGTDAMPEGAYISSIAVDPADPDRVMITFSNYEVRSIFYSENAGATWSHVSGNLEEDESGEGDGPSTRWAQILPVSGGTMYFVGTSTGLYSTTELAGSTTEWIQEGASSIGNVVVDMIDTRPADNLVVAATHGNGIYSAFADVDLSTGEPLEPGEAYQISPAFPNPFRSSAQFVLRVAHEQEVEVALYDAAGRRVDEPFSGRLEPNVGHTIEIDAGALASGVYIYRVDGERFSTSEQVVLVR